MPLTRISMLKGRHTDTREQLKSVIADVIVDKLNVPANDRFILLDEYDADQFHYDPTCLDIERTDDLLIIQITLVVGRPTEVKKQFYEALAEQLHQQLQLRKEDIFVNLIEVTRDNWSYGNGIAQFAL
ncbi:tautomerase family protein [Paenibacillus hunanensis]|uniref:tautomerase family protein n=1 Tax=Paenibacillus hunanensis TaxID=539262 RepID=UPI0020270FC0|nr:tautomerase family protein [Paenibacillus hunanensis]MCL9661439.1 tautomerase family protein [Paenibacillus hunanensis]